MGEFLTHLNQHPTAVAPWLLGAVLRHDGIAIRITEVEAYGGVGEDPGSHAFRGPTKRNAVMFGSVGHLYVYFTYGMHWCANVVAHEDGQAGAVLLRAGEVIEGHERAQRGRVLPAHRVASGPARLATAMNFAGQANGLALLDLLTFPKVIPDHATSLRTGVSGAGGQIPWRYYLPGEASVSPYRAARVKP